MLIDWNAFTPWASFAGGAAIGVAVVLLILFNARIAGISGIVGGVACAEKGDISWRLAFIGGLIAAPLVWQLFSGLPALEIDGSFLMIALTGLIRDWHAL